MEPTLRNLGAELLEFPTPTTTVSALGAGHYSVLSLGLFRKQLPRASPDDRFLLTLA